MVHRPTGRGGCPACRSCTPHGFSRREPPCWQPPSQVYFFVRVGNEQRAWLDTAALLLCRLSAGCRCWVLVLRGLQVPHRLVRCIVRGHRYCMLSESCHVLLLQLLDHSLHEVLRADQVGHGGEFKLLWRCDRSGKVLLPRCALRCHWEVRLAIRHHMPKLLISQAHCSQDLGFGGFQQTAVKARCFLCKANRCCLLPKAFLHEVLCHPFSLTQHIIPVAMWAYRLLCWEEERAR
mmetsp:Transcript_19472/g.42185  ORF Transcript_19472/g.42185 Transcript_19472/m.42185 type:complete len:235 (+) Transcript_19472:1057-1761(+)